LRDYERDKGERGEGKRVRGTIMPKYIVYMYEGGVT
jgi:hypothetical protein